MNDKKIIINEIKNNKIYSEPDNKENRSTSPQDDALLEKKRLLSLSKTMI